MDASAEVAPLPEVADRTRVSRAPESTLEKQRERLAWLLILPSILVVLLVAVYPLYQTFRLSFTNTVRGSGRSVRSGNASRSFAITVGLVKRKKVLICISTSRVET